ncbi:MAG: acetamidase/formamidase family protein [Armatimonadaceae bacterium]
MASYFIEPERRTLHGHWSRDLPPVETVHSGDTVTFRTLDASWALEPRTEQWFGTNEFSPRDSRRDRGHALCGPVAVRGAEPGMTLAIRFDEIRPADWGWTLAGGKTNERNQVFQVQDTMVCHRWCIDPEAGFATNQHGHRVAIRPFMGVVGLAPAKRGIHDTRPPRTVGGNIDCKELVVGSTLYLPIEVSGALFSLGDGHAAQGDGEVSGFALECPMERVTVTLTVLPDQKVTTPCAETPTGYLTMGFDHKLDRATEQALNALLDYITTRYNVSRPDAYALASVAADLRVTQIVNDVQGVHAFLPHDAIQTNPSDPAA